MPTTTRGHAEYEAVANQTPKRLAPHLQAVPPEGSSPIDRDEKGPAAWGIGWQCPTLMVGLVISGASLAVGHHLYYRKLDGTMVESISEQTWAIRIGTGLAFLVKACLVSTVGIAAVQEIWATLRRKSLKLSGIDGMFAVLGNPFAFFVPDLWVYAKTLTLLAIISWLIPLTAVITPATLSVHLRPTSNNTELQVPTANFSNDFWDNMVTTQGAGMIRSPSAAISRLFTATASSLEVLTVPAPFPNASYSLAFWGPSYKCQGLAEAITAAQGMRYTDAFDEDASYTLRELWEHEIANETTRGTIFLGAAPTSILNNVLFVRATGENHLANRNASEPTEIVCQLWNTSYVVDLRFTNGIQTLTPISVEHLAPANWSSRDGTYTLLESRSEANAGFHVTHLLFSGLIQGTIRNSVSLELSESKSSEAPFTTLSITQTGLFGCPEMWNISSSGFDNTLPSSTPCRNGTFARTLEDLSHNFTYSLLSLKGGNTSTDVTAMYPQNFYTYNDRNLFLAYGVALGVTIASTIVGFLALHKNGVTHSTSFSAALLTTRNPELDGLAFGHCLGSDPLEKEVGRVRLRFGELNGPQGHRHAAFGVKGSVSTLLKGEAYY
ncbi:uncharacterized protein BDV17DRAFT_293646 [Aspergillus undulatus]|uniref:uncharacterized protein n=1 Tax=Aspergillus undulatus TaxID=1810928 RepID=UPI003CCD76E8